MSWSSPTPEKPSKRAVFRGGAPAQHEVRERAQAALGLLAKVVACRPKKRCSHASVLARVRCKGKIRGGRRAQDVRAEGGCGEMREVTGEGMRWRHVLPDSCTGTGARCGRGLVHRYAPVHACQAVPLERLRFTPGAAARGRCCGDDRHVRTELPAGATAARSLWQGVGEAQDHSTVCLTVPSFSHLSVQDGHVLPVPPPRPVPPSSWLSDMPHWLSDSPQVLGAGAGVCRFGVWVMVGACSARCPGAHVMRHWDADFD